MSPNAVNTFHAVRRRPSFLSRVRPKTAGGEQDTNEQSSHLHSSIWAPSGDGSYREAVSHFSHEPGRAQDEDVSPLCLPLSLRPEPLESSNSTARNRRHSKSISCLRNGVSELRAVVRRFSVTIRHKSHKHSLEVPRERTGLETYPEEHHRNGTLHTDFRSHRMHRQSFSSFPLLNRSQSHTPGIPYPIPANAPELPLFPEELSGGQAARAAAAAQNEMIRLERVASNSSARAFEVILDQGTKVSLDSESGIEINIQDTASIVEDDLDVVRKGVLLVIVFTSPY